MQQFAQRKLWVEGWGAVRRRLQDAQVLRELAEIQAMLAGADRVERLREAARPLAGARVLQINTTAYGGGVAELLHSHVPLLNDLGLEVEWALFQGSDEFFSITKAMHNALQGAEIAWTLEMQDRYWERIAANTGELTETYDFVLVHDPHLRDADHLVDTQVSADGEPLRYGPWDPRGRGKLRPGEVARGL